MHKRVQQLVATITPSGVPSVPTGIAWTAGIKPESLVLACVYLGRLLASVDEGSCTSEPAQQFAALAPLHFATCVTLADKYCNDRSYDNILPLVADAALIDPALLRRAELAAWGVLLDVSVMSVEPDEFDAFALLIHDTIWEQIGTDCALALLSRTARSYAVVLPAGAVAQPFMRATLDADTTPGTASTGALHAFGSIFGRVRGPRAAYATEDEAAVERTSSSEESGRSSSATSVCAHAERPSAPSSSKAASDDCAALPTKPTSWVDRYRVANISRRAAQTKAAAATTSSGPAGWLGGRAHGSAVSQALAAAARKAPPVRRSGTSENRSLARLRAPMAATTGV